LGSPSSFDNPNENHGLVRVDPLHVSDRFFSRIRGDTSAVPVTTGVQAKDVLHALDELAVDPTYAPHFFSARA
jgi:hypothetical protein